MSVLAVGWLSLINGIGNLMQLLFSSTTKTKQRQNSLWSLKCAKVDHSDRVFSYSVQGAALQDRTREEWNSAYSKNCRKEKQPLLYPRYAWRCGTDVSPWKRKQENESKHCFWWEKPNQEDLRQDPIQHLAAKIVQVCQTLLVKQQLFIINLWNSSCVVSVVIMSMLLIFKKKNKVQHIWPMNAEQGQNIFALPVNTFKCVFALSLFWKPVYNVLI